MTYNWPMLDNPTIDLNCDLGEGEPAARTRALMRWMHSANIACGGHAGNPESMRRCVRLAAERGVRVGAHPGPAGGFGRNAQHIEPQTLATAVLHQVGALQVIAAAEGSPLHHVKLHGAYYHASEADPVLARVYLSTLSDYFPQVRVYALAGGRVATLARNMGIEVREEMFADRAYRADGSLVPRSQPGALLDAPHEAIERFKHWLHSGRMRTMEGHEIEIAAQTVCLHGDHPHALALARALGKLLS